MRFKDAYTIGLSVWEALKPHCEITKIAGSIRRERPDVKDIEIVCVPKEVEKAKDLFGGDQGMIRVPSWSDEIKKLGNIVKGKPDGKYLQIDMVEPAIKIDVFMPSPADFYRIFAIRTGSAEWTAKYLAGAWKKLGWCGSDAGLRLQKECIGTKGADHKTTWRCFVPKDQQTLPPVWKSEKELFEWLKIKWVDPKFRNI